MLLCLFGLLVGVCFLRLFCGFDLRWVFAGCLVCLESAGVVISRCLLW